MYKYFNRLNTDDGKALPGYQVRIMTTEPEVAVDIFADESGTPIESVSGVANAAITDNGGNYQFFVEPGTYNIVFSSPGGTFLDRIRAVPMLNGPKGDKGDTGGPRAVATLADLKAALTGDDTFLYDSAPFKWTSGNFTGQADDINIVKSDFFALSAGAWVRQGADKVAVKRPGTAAVTQTVQQVLDRLPVDVRDYGAVGDFVADDTDAIRDAVAEAVSSGVRAIALGSLRYKTTRTVSIPLNFTIYSDGAVLDATEDFDTSEGLNALYIGSDVVTPIPNLAGDETAGNTLVGFTSAHGLAAGDVGCIYNPTDFSFSSSRPEYREGEFFEVAKATSGVQVLLASGLAVSHSAAVVDCYKMDTGTFTLVGKLTVRIAQPAPTDATNAVFIQQVVRSSVTGLRAEAEDGAYAGIITHRCYRSNFLDYDAEQSDPSVGGDGYGYIVANCQRCTTRGNAYSSRHALAHGGYDGPCNVPNRDISHTGTWSTPGNGTVPAVDVHGNADGIQFRGLIDGGITCGGKAIDARFCTIKAHPTLGIAIQLGEVKKPNFDFSATRILGNSIDPAAPPVERATVDIGSNGTFEANNLESGTIRFIDAILDAPMSTRGLVAIKRNGSEIAGAKHSLDLRGMTINVDPMSGIPAYVEIAGSATANWDVVDARDATFNGGANSIVLETDTVMMPSQFGSVGIPVTTAQTSNSVEVTFDNPFPSGYRPKVQVGFRGDVTNGAFLDVKAHNVSNTAFFVTIHTINGTNFAAARTDTVEWTAQ